MTSIRLLYVIFVHGQNHKISSSVFHSIFLASGDDSISSGNLDHYRAEIVTFGLCMLSLSG